MPPEKYLDDDEVVTIYRKNGDCQPRGNNVNDPVVGYQKDDTQYYAESPDMIKECEASC